MKLNRKTVKIIRNILDGIRITTFIAGFLCAFIAIGFADVDLAMFIIFSIIAVICFGIAFVIDNLFYTE